MATAQEKAQSLEITRPLSDAQKTVLSEPAVQFLARLARKFESTRQECLLLSSELHAIVCAFRLLR